MNLRCPITYELLAKGERYSKKGLRLLSPKLHHLVDLPLNAEEQRIEARRRSAKMSVQGVQLKLSAKVNIIEQAFEICDFGGNFILKPPNELYPELPENEDLSMRLASKILEVPLHGLIYSADGSFTYFIKRFDRLPRGKKLAIEDFSQLSGMTRETKYNFSMERIVGIVDRFCTFPVLEKSKLFKIVLFNYLIGNEDMHLKNYSLISRNGKVELSPAYDYINTTIAMGNAKEEIALPLHGKKNHLTSKDIIDYYGMGCLSLNAAVLNEILEQFWTLIPEWKEIIKTSFLSDKSKEYYLSLLEARVKNLKMFDLLG